MENLAGTRALIRMAREMVRFYYGARWFATSLSGSNQTCTMHPAAGGSHEPEVAAL